MSASCTTIICEYRLGYCTCICVKYFRMVLRGKEADFLMVIFNAALVKLKLISKNTVQLFLRSKFFKFSDIKFSMFKLS